MNNKIENDIKITVDQMKAAVKLSGYLLEQRVEQILNKRQYLVQANTAYRDSDTSKSREVDINAMTFNSIIGSGHAMPFSHS